jgi:hypothetical protein
MNSRSPLRSVISIGFLGLLRQEIAMAGRANAQEIGFVCVAESRGSASFPAHRGLLATDSVLHPTGSFSASFWFVAYLSATFVSPIFF